MNFKKYVLRLTILLCLPMLITACGKKESPAAAASAVLPAETFSSSFEPGKPAIVFHDTIDDPQAEYLDTSGGNGSEASGTASLDLVLYETEPNVFEGCGMMVRSVNITRGDTGTTEEKYVFRTGHIHAEIGREAPITMTGWLIDSSNIPAMIPEAPFDVAIHKDATQQQEGLLLLLLLSGSQASLSIKLHNCAEFVFSGEKAAASTELSVGKPSDPESLIYINSMWSRSFSDRADGGEYTAILLASPKAGAYSGQLSIQGTGNALNDISEAVTFSFEPFDPATYQKAGGRQDDRFASMSFLQAAGKTYILLLDGEQAFLEPAGKSGLFCGGLYAQSESAAFLNEADKTEALLRDLYREKSSTKSQLPDYSELKDVDPGNAEDLQKLMDISGNLNGMISHQDAPAWYPESLIPMVRFSEDDGFRTIPPSAGQLFRIYNTGYCESEDFENLTGPYRSALSGYDHYQEYLNYDDLEGVFLFTMGKYTVQVYLKQSVMKLTDIAVQIY